MVQLPYWAGRGSAAGAAVLRLHVMPLLQPQRLAFTRVAHTAVNRTSETLLTASHATSIPICSTPRAFVAAIHTDAAALAKPGAGRHGEPGPQPEGSRGVLCLPQGPASEHLRITNPCGFSAVPVVSEGVAAPMPAPGCSPLSYAPAACTVAKQQQQQQQQRQGRQPGTRHYIGGLPSLLRGHGAVSRGAVHGSTLLQLPPGPHPAGGAPRPSLQVALLNQQDAGPGVVQAMHQHSARHGPWVGTWAHSATQYQQIAAAATMGDSASTVSTDNSALTATADGSSGHASTVTAAAAPSPVCPATDLSNRPCMLRVPRFGRYSGREISMPAGFVAELAGRRMDTPGEKVLVPIYVPGSEPKAFLPDSCYVRTRLLRKDTVKTSMRLLLGGLGAFLLQNMPVEGSTLLLLTAVPPDLARGYPTASLAVQLISHKDVGYDVFAAMQEHLAARNTVWYGRRADLVPFFAAEAQRLSALGRGGTRAGPLDAGLTQSTRSTRAAYAGRRRLPLLARGPRVPGEQTVQQRLSMLPEGLDQAHVKAAEAFLQAAADGKVARIVQPSMISIGRRSGFAAAFGARRQPSCYPLRTSGPLTGTYLRVDVRKTHAELDWWVCGFKPWLADVGAQRGDLLLLWGEEAAPEAGETGKRGGDGTGGEGGRLGLRVHLIRRGEVGSEALEKIVGAVSVW